jgi:hypothetical protein
MPRNSLLAPLCLGTSKGSDDLPALPRAQGCLQRGARPGTPGTLPLRRRVDQVMRPDRITLQSAPVPQDTADITAPYTANVNRGQQLS